MNEYTHDEFYDLTHLSKNETIDLFYDAKERSYHWWVDVLKNLFRTRVEMNFEEIIKKYDESCHAVFTYRRGYVPQNQNSVNDIWRWKLEIGFSTMVGTSYYLFIHVEQDELKYFVEKYKLKTL